MEQINAEKQCTFFLPRTLKAQASSYANMPGIVFIRRRFVYSLNDSTTRIYLCRSCRCGHSDSRLLLLLDNRVTGLAHTYIYIYIYIYIPGIYIYYATYTACLNNEVICQRVLSLVSGIVDANENRCPRYTLAFSQ